MTISSDLQKHAMMKATQAIVDVAVLDDQPREFAYLVNREMFIAAIAALLVGLPRDERSRLMNIAFKQVFTQVHKTVEALDKDPHVQEILSNLPK